MPGRTRRLRVGVLSLAALLLLSLVASQSTAVRKSARAVISSVRGILLRPNRPRVAWESARPAQEGMDPEALRRLSQALADAGTTSFLVVRGNRVVYEWYSAGSGPNVPHGMAAMAKAVTGTVALMAAVTDRRLALDDPASKYIPRWQTDSLRRAIRIRHLASHRSGMEDVDFGLGMAKQLNGWKQRYFDHPGDRFDLAIDTAAILFPPGTRIGYSGVGYYALAYALGFSVREAPEREIKTLLRERVFQPLGIPDGNYKLSYEESYDVDGMTLYALGSGADYSARAAARIGELMLDHGRFGDRRLLDSGLVAEVLKPGPDSAPPPSGLPEAPPAAGSGWWLNIWASWPGVPRDAFAGIGAEHQVILVVPSLDLVMVRLGKRLSPDPAQFESALREQLFNPLIRAIVGPSSRMGSKP